MKKKLKRKIGQAVARLSLYIVVEIAFYNFAIWVLDNCFTTMR